jgi:hypothetical protein
MLPLPDPERGTVDVFCPQCALVYVIGSKEDVEKQMEDDAEEWHDPDVEGES